MLAYIQTTVWLLLVIAYELGILLKNFKSQSFLFLLDK